MPRHSLKRRSGSAVGNTSVLTAWERATFALLLAPVAALLWFSGSALLSSLYSNLLDSSLQGLRWRIDPQSLSQRAVELAPWRSATRMQQAQLISADRRMGAAVEAASAGLERAPADARLWAYWARLRGAADRYDDAMLGAYRLAVAQAPHAWTVRESIAFDGVMRWRHGSEELRQVWTDSIAFAMYRRRKEFAREIIHYGRDPYFCATVGKRLKLDELCSLTARARVFCADKQIKPAGIAWCVRQGFMKLEVAP